MKRIVCYVTDSQSLGVTEPCSDILTKIEAAVKAGVDWVQIREKEMPTRQLLAIARAAVRMTNRKPAPPAGEDRPGSLILVNDRLDVALAGNAAGIHLGRESLAAQDVIGLRRRRKTVTDLMVGLSCHTIDELRQAEDAGVDYAFLGPVFDTPTKRLFGPPLGIAKLAAACRATRLNVIAIGGVTLENGAECLHAGAAGIAAIRMFQQAWEPAELKKAVERLHSVGQR
ncbi:MAG TPA: thiamine phosphate synthase [Candidatus Acidoferrales bacterium]|nr:thiamine phosphate synthase [Candidatus Acidoferrales bacterium]